MRRYFLETPIGPIEERIQAFMDFAGYERLGASAFVLGASDTMRDGYHAGVRRVAAEGIVEMREELGIPETPRSWHLKGERY
jgi:hypothetical protein